MIWVRGARSSHRREVGVTAGDVCSTAPGQTGQAQARGQGHGVRSGVWTCAAGAARWCEVWSGLILIALMGPAG